MAKARNISLVIRELSAAQWAHHVLPDVLGVHHERVGEIGAGLAACFADYCSSVRRRRRGARGDRPHLTGQEVDVNRVEPGRRRWLSSPP